MYANQIPILLTAAALSMRFQFRSIFLQFLGPTTPETAGRREVRIGIIPTRALAEILLRIWKNFHLLTPCAS